MLNDSVYSDISARCGGSAHIGVAGADAQRAASLNAALPQWVTENNYVVFVHGDEGADGVIDYGDGYCGGLPCVAAEEGEEPASLVRRLLFAFPALRIDVCVPAWVRSLPADNSAVAELISRVRSCAEGAESLAQCSNALEGMLADSANWCDDVDIELFPAEGRASVTAKIKDGAFFGMLSETAGEEITDESSLMAFAVSAAQARKNYDRVKDALECARVNGYGIVPPSFEELSLEKPSVVRQGGNLGVKLRATAPSYHIVKVEVCSEVNPVMGAASQTQSMVDDMISGFERDGDGMWDTDLFGKSLRSMVRDGLSGRAVSLRDDTRSKLRRALTRMVNEGKGGVICILL